MVACAVAQVKPTYQSTEKTEPRDAQLPVWWCLAKNRLEYGKRKMKPGMLAGLAQTWVGQPGGPIPFPRASGSFRWRSKFYAQPVSSPRSSVNSRVSADRCRIREASWKTVCLPVKFAVSFTA